MEARLVSRLALACLVASSCAPSAEREQRIEIGDRSARIHLPDDHGLATPAPLLILLHGFGSDGEEHESYLRFAPVARERGLLYVHPDGTEDCNGARFWNATPACCNFCDSEVDDSAWLLALIEAIRARYAVDPQRIYLVGHSNGGFMSLRLACDRADLIAAMVGIAGAADPASCEPSEPVHVLQIHGTGDPTIRYEGGRTQGGDYPGAVSTVEWWAQRAGCSAPETGERMDLDAGVPGPETEVTRYSVGCRPGGSAELWTMHDSDHTPDFRSGFAERVIEYLLFRAKPDGQPRVH